MGVEAERSQACGGGDLPSPQRYSHALSRWHPFLGIAPHSMPAAEGGQRKDWGQEETRTGPQMFAHLWCVLFHSPGIY